MSKSLSWRYRHKKPIPVASEDSLKPSLSSRLTRQGWRYAPKRQHGLGQNTGGHWVPPGYRKPGYQQAEATLSKGDMSTRRQITQTAMKSGPFSQGPRFGGPKGGRPANASTAKARFQKNRKAIPMAPAGKGSERRYLKR